MYCPICGSAEPQARQFCRQCGGDLRAVIAALQDPDSAGSGRDEVYRALAAKIKECHAGELKSFVEEVMPKIEQLMESPNQRQRRQIRDGITWFSSGVGMALFFFLRPFSTFLTNGSVVENVFCAVGLTTALSGLGYLISTIFFPVSGRSQTEKRPRENNGFRMPSSDGTRFGQPTSITENTTRELEANQIKGETGAESLSLAASRSDSNSTT